MHACAEPNGRPRKGVHAGLHKTVSIINLHLLGQLCTSQQLGSLRNSNQVGACAAVASVGEPNCFAYAPQRTHAWACSNPELLVFRRPPPAHQHQRSSVCATCSTIGPTRPSMPAACRRQMPCAAVLVRGATQCAERGGGWGGSKGATHHPRCTLRSDLNCWSGQHPCLLAPWHLAPSSSSSPARWVWPGGAHIGRVGGSRCPPGFMPRRQRTRRQPSPSPAKTFDQAARGRSRAGSASRICPASAACSSCQRALFSSHQGTACIARALQSGGVGVGA